MSKKKNTLKDLDEFLKQQAATLVSPSKLSQEEEKPEQAKSAEQEFPSANLNIDQIINLLNTLAVNEQTDSRRLLYDFIIKAVEKMPSSLPEDKMLINTALYLKHGEQWKEEIRKYWKEK